MYIYVYLYRYMQICNYKTIDMHLMQADHCWCLSFPFKPLLASIDHPAIRMVEVNQPIFSRVLTIDH